MSKMSYLLKGMAVQVMEFSRDTKFERFLAKNEIVEF